jgi:hypothetical protein
MKNRQEIKGKFFRCQTIISLPIVLLHSTLMNDLIMWIKQNCWSIRIPCNTMRGAECSAFWKESSLCRLLILIHKCVHYHFRVQTFMVKGTPGRRRGSEWHATCVWIINYIFTSFLVMRENTKSPTLVMSWHDSLFPFHIYSVSINRPKPEHKLECAAE